MLRWFISLPIGAVLLAGHHPAQAQNYGPHQRLDKVDQVRIEAVMVGNRKKDACVVDRDRLNTSIKFLLNTAKIPFVEGFPEIETNQTLLSDEELTNQQREWNIPALWVVGDVMSVGAGCVYNVEIKLEENVDTMLLYSKTHYSGSVELWHTGYYGISDPSRLTDELAQITDEAIKEFVNLRADDIKRWAQQ
jgi:hypothetical protein